MISIKADQIRFNGIFVLSFFLVGCSASQPDNIESNQMATSNVVAGKALLTTAEEKFLERHWPDRIAVQGPVPDDYSELEASLTPDACGTCHRQQYQDWQTSLHSRSMGPGVLGQLLVMDKDDPVTADTCRDCHTPLAEQRPIISGLMSGSVQENDHYDPALQQRGLTCAGCHVRRHQRFGPPRVTAPDVTGMIDGNLPHNGFTAETAFTKSGFCRGCHQFKADDFALNGKLIENTYSEWLASDYPEQGKQCQTCHMPDRRHLWRGVHDPDMVRNGISISVELSQREYEQGENVEALITVANTGVGHYFPTYVTPKVFVRAMLLDAAGNKIEASLQEAIIGREVTLDLSNELYDTRIPPNDSVVIQYVQPLTQNAAKLKVSVTIDPDHFYARFFQATLENGTAGEERMLLEEALRNALQSSFSIYEQVLPLEVKQRAGLSNGTVILGQPPTVPSQLSNTPVNQNNHSPVDWNDREINWHGYREGLRLAQESGKPILLIFYAEWCPTCHAYKDIFREGSVIDATSGFVMVRVDVDDEPAVNQAYVFDGEYVPRTFALTPEGQVMHELYPEKSYARYFLRADDSATFVALMHIAAVQASRL